MQERALGVKARLVTLLGFGREEVGPGLARTEDIANGRAQHLVEFRLTQVPGQTFGKCWNSGCVGVRRGLVRTSRILKKERSNGGTRYNAHSPREKLAMMPCCLASLATASARLYPPLRATTRATLGCKTKALYMSSTSGRVSLNMSFWSPRRIFSLKCEELRCNVLRYRGMMRKGIFSRNIGTTYSHSR